MRKKISINTLLFLMIISSLSIAFVVGGDSRCYAEGTEVEESSLEEYQSDMAIEEKQANVSEVEVSDIEIGNYEKELEVGKTQTISATVLPSDATNSTITYMSSNTNIATVNSSGEIKGISKGTVNIDIKAGNITKTITISVKVATTKIDINNNYLVLKPGEQFQLSSTAIPSDAVQTISYKSLNNDIATVSEDGLVTAKAIGDGTIIVSNGDLSSSVTVIVNSSTTEKSEILLGNNTEEVEELSKKENKLIELIEKSKSDITIQANEYKEISKSILKKLYENKKTLIINGDNYKIKVIGSKIVNYENKLYTNLKFDKENSGISFVLNDKRNLPGEVEILLSGKEANGKYIYLYNDATKKYQKLDIKDISKLNLNEAGKYLITEKKLSNLKVSLIVVAIVGFIVIISFGVYIAINKKYWFW